MEENARHDHATMETLTRALFGIAGIRRDLRRRAGMEHVPVGLTALGAVKRVGPARVSDIAIELQVDLSVASRQIQGLEADGLVVRIPDPSDRRSSLVSLSEAGEEKLGRVLKRLTTALGEALGDWEPAAVDGLIDGLLRLRADLAVVPPVPADSGDADRAKNPPTLSGSNQEHSA